MTHSRFSRQHGRSTFKCQACGRLTRDVDQGGTDLCPECYELAGIDNELNDNGREPTAKELEVCNGCLESIGKKGGDVEAAKASCEYIWTEAQS